MSLFVLFCSQQSITRVIGSSFYGAGTGQIWMDGVHCTGTEASIDQCRFNQPWGTNDCTHSEDLSIVCSGIYPLKISNSFCYQGPIKVSLVLCVN